MFLNPETEIGRQISKSIVQADFDDDCATDEDMKNNAQRLLHKELRQGIERFNLQKRSGPHQAKRFVKNINAVARFQNPKVWIDSDDE